MSIAREVRDILEIEGRLVLPQGIRVVASGYGKHVVFIFPDGSELNCAALQVVESAASDAGAGEYSLDP